MREIINEEVNVVMYYSAKKKLAQPYLINWQGRDFSVGRIGYCHNYMEGRDRQHIFEVVDKENTMHFRLRLDSSNLHWTLETIHDGMAS